MVSVTDVSLELFKKCQILALWNSTRAEIFPTFKRSKKRQTNSPGNSSLFFTLFFPQVGQVLLSLFKAKFFFSLNPFINSFFNAIYLHCNICLRTELPQKKEKRPKQVTHSLIRFFIKREMRGALIE